VQEFFMTDEVQEPGQGDGVPTRRRLLMLGAASASVVITIRPALASTTASVMNCQIPVPDSARAGRWIAQDGTLVDPNVPGAFPPPARPLKGEEVKSAILNGRPYPGTNYDASKAYTNYIRRLQRGTSGFTCFASLQMPRG